MAGVLSMSCKLQAFTRSSSKDVEASMKAAAQRFGFKKQQQKGVEATLCGRDVFVSWPTGFGIYQFVRKPDLDFWPFVIVVSPLISLMQDQVANLQAKRFKATLRVGRQYGRDDTCELNPTTHPIVFVSPEGLEESPLSTLWGAVCLKICNICWICKHCTVFA